ncbi:MAG TPA: prolyl oligopeptidase family serine peptidase [Kofleriaceae bacterium]
MINRTTTAPARQARIAVLVLASIASTACQPPAAAPPAPPSAPPPATSAGPTLGLRTFEAVDPITKAALPIAVVYPAAGAADPASATTVIGPYTVAAGRGLEVAAGRWPLVVISHGHGGSPWGHHDLAEALARAGTVVAMVEHIGDSWRDQSAFRSDRVMYGRAYQVSATIDRVLAEPALAAQIDPDRIGVAGFSAGGYTSLLMVGAEPDFTRVPAYCQRHTDDAEICGGSLRVELTAVQRTPTRDPRVRAAFAMAPFAVAFGPAQLRAITAPVFLAWATADQKLLPAENAAAIAPALPTLAGRRVIEGAGHFVFLAPCSSALATDAAELCTDPPGIDRAAIHTQLAADAVQFFARALAVRSAPPR